MGVRIIRWFCYFMCYFVLAVAGMFLFPDSRAAQLVVLTSPVLWMAMLFIALALDIREGIL